jgi:hypothetical protein
MKGVPSLSPVKGGQRVKHAATRRRRILAGKMTVTPASIAGRRVIGPKTAECRRRRMPTSPRRMMKNLC